MRRFLLATLTMMTLASPLAAQGMTFPTFDFPAPGTFCGPLQLCQPEATRDDNR